MELLRSVAPQPPAALVLRASSHNRTITFTLILIDHLPGMASTTHRPLACGIRLIGGRTLRRRGDSATGSRSLIANSSSPSTAPQQGPCRAAQATLTARQQPITYAHGQQGARSNLR